MGFKDALAKTREARAKAEAEEKARKDAYNAKRAEEMAVFESLKRKEIIDVLEEVKNEFASEKHFADVQPRMTLEPTMFATPPFTMELALRQKGYPAPTAGQPDQSFRLSVWFDANANAVQYLVRIPERALHGQPNGEKPKAQSVPVEKLQTPGFFENEVIAPFAVAFDNHISRKER